MKKDKEQIAGEEVRQDSQVHRVLPLPTDELVHTRAHSVDLLYVACKHCILVQLGSGHTTSMQKLWIFL